MPESDRGRILLGIARDAIGDPSGPRTPRTWEPAWLREQAATFVTLRDASGELRGCIGTVDAHRALGDDVAHNAHAAAYRDPRFAPVDSRERPTLGVEVPVLTPRVAFPAKSEAEAIANLRPGEDGVVFEYRDQHATFLPQVWENLSDPLMFLSELRRKARLPPRFWHDEVRLWRYTVEKHA
jgi:AmmeMemoRadiSam system protein A